MLNNVTHTLLDKLLHPTNVSKSSSMVGQVCPLLKQVRSANDITLPNFHGGCIVLSFLNAAFAVTSIFCNLVVFVAFYKSETIRSPSNLLLLGLSICDFMVGVVTQPLLTVETALFVADVHAVCAVKDLYIIFLFSFSSSSLAHICLTCGERFLAIFFPFWHQRHVTKPTVLKAVVVFWFLWVLLTVFTRQEHGGGVIGYSRIAFVIVSALIVILINLRLWAEAQRHLMEINSVQTNGRAADTERENKATKTIVSIIGLLLLCNLPLVTTFVARKFFGQRGRLATLLWLASNTVALLPASLNPVTYYWRRADIREAVRRVFPRNRVRVEPSLRPRNIGS